MRRSVYVPIQLIVDLEFIKSVSKMLRNSTVVAAMHVSVRTSLVIAKVSGVQYRIDIRLTRELR